jgi:hypothetical protein
MIKLCDEFFATESWLHSWFRMMEALESGRGLAAESLGNDVVVHRASPEVFDVRTDASAHLGWVAWAVC